MYIIVFVCSNCGLELFRHASGFLRPDPKRVIKLCGGRCPRCGRKLEVPGGRLGFSSVREYKSMSVRSENSKTVTVKVSPHFDEIIEDVARRLGYASKSDFVRDAILDFIWRRG